MLVPINRHNYYTHSYARRKIHQTPTDTGAHMYISNSPVVASPCTGTYLLTAVARPPCGFQIQVLPFFEFILDLHDQVLLLR